MSYENRYKRQIAIALGCFKSTVIHDWHAQSRYTSGCGTLFHRWQATAFITWPRMTDQMVAHQAHILASAAWSVHDLHDRSAGNAVIAVCPAITKYVAGNWRCSPTALVACQCDVVLAACCSKLACRCGCTTPAPLHETRRITHASR